MKKSTKQKTKRSYQSPRLVKFGNVERLTKTSAKGGAKRDGGGNPPTKA